MGVPVDEKDITAYEKHLQDFGFFVQNRIFTPYIHRDFLYRLLGYARQGSRICKPMLNFTIDLIKRRRAILEKRTEQQAGNDSESENNSM